jgi:hypothetical protein
MDPEALRVVEAWDTDGPVAEKYRHLKRWLHSDWPELAAALDALAEACPGNATHYRGPHTGKCVFCGKEMPG